MDAGRVRVFFLKGRVHLWFWGMSVTLSMFMLSSDGFVLVQIRHGLGGRICSIGHVFKHKLAGFYFALTFFIFIH